jgi:hypothetical protein
VSAVAKKGDYPAPWWWGGEQSQGFPDNNHSNALEASRVLKVGPGVLFGLSVFNNNAATQFIQLHDSQTVPADGAVPVFFFPVATQSSFFVQYAPPGRQFLYGIVVCNSSTGPTKTVGAADCFFDAQFV